jgi:hypothetical protein
MGRTSARVDIGIDWVVAMPSLTARVDLQRYTAFANDNNREMGEYMQREEGSDAYLAPSANKCSSLKEIFPSDSNFSNISSALILLPG